MPRRAAGVTAAFFGVGNDKKGCPMLCNGSLKQGPPVYGEGASVVARSSNADDRKRFRREEWPPQRGNGSHPSSFNTNDGDTNPGGAGAAHVVPPSLCSLNRNKDSLSLLLTVGPRVFDLGRIAVANDIRSSFCFAAIRTLRGAA